MKQNHYLYFILLQFFTPFFIYSQNIGIHAESVGEWQSKQTFSPEYHYNSVAVYLLNEERLADLFNPNNLSREERKQTGLKKFDELESLYFSLQLPNPKNEAEVIDFPLYAFDIHRAKSFSVPRNQGKIIDRITDEELNGRGLDAKARIEAVKKNQLLEVAYQISTTVNKILTNRLFLNPGISGVMQKAQEFFEKKYRGSIVSEFNIPILPSNEDYEYRLQAASLYQIKWNFQAKVTTYKDNIWSDLQDLEPVAEEKLKDKPSRLSRLKKHPYLLVLRYKSAYSLPEAHKLNVEISQKELEKRLYNLQEFHKNGNQYRTEEAFLSLLRDAIDLQRNCEMYRSSKDKGEAEKDLIIRIAQQHYDLLCAYKKELAYCEKYSIRKAYFEENYAVVYYKFFKLLDNLLFLDEQLKEIGQVAHYLTDLNQIEIERLNATEIYDYLKKLETYRQVALGLEQIEGDLFYKIRDKIYQLEKNLYPQKFNVPPIGDKQQRIQQLKALKKQYALCVLCEKEANSQIEQIQQSIDDEVRSELYALQNQQLKYRKCFSDIQQYASKQLKEQFTEVTTLSQIEEELYHSYLEKIEGMDPIAQQFQQIEQLSIRKLSSEKLHITLQEYQSILAKFQGLACQLYYGHLLSKDLLNCLEGDCRVKVP